MGDSSALGYTSPFKTAPRLGIALSGGSFRAALYGAGVLNAFDARNGSSKAAGTGGLLQVASYLSALSGTSVPSPPRQQLKLTPDELGGSWLTTSLYSNDFPPIQDLVMGTGSGLSGWLLDLDLFLPTGFSLKLAENVVFYDTIVASVKAKAKAGLYVPLQTRRLVINITIGRLA